jgi:cellulose synthase/poly-beta-1,6-N-acetylglucosamine synthase-like glycosyltransferase
MGGFVMIKVISFLFNYIIFFYGLGLIVSYVILAIMSYFAQRKSEIDYPELPAIKLLLSNSPYAPGISIIAPAYNEEVTIVDNVHSLLSVDYPKFEVVIVNDGSTDSTLDLLIKEFSLHEVPYYYEEKVKCRPVIKVMKSTLQQYDNLIVIDKEHGGTKADGSNAGINVSSFPFFICTDVDSIITHESLYRIVWPIIASKKKVIGVSATMLMSNGCKIENGKLVQAKMPYSPIPLFQQLEYLRSFLIGKMGWSSIGALSNISGGFGFFDKETVINVGGYDSQSFAEDMDLMLRMVRYMCDTHQEYLLAQVPYVCCWTEGPPTISVLYKQRTRWARGLFQIMATHKDMIFSKRYGILGTILMPYLFIFEFIAPVIEILGFLYLVWLIIINGVNWNTAWIMFLMIYLFSIILSIIVCLYDYVIRTTQWKGLFNGYPRLVLASMLEPFFYHPFIAIFSLIGYGKFMSRSQMKWGKMKRQGFNKAN